jgi:lipoate-protein ligase B
MPSNKPLVLKARRTKMHSLKLNVQFDSNEMEMLNAYLMHQKNVSSFDELSEIGLLNLIKIDYAFMKKFNSGEFTKEEKTDERPDVKKEKPLGAENSDA